VANINRENENSLTFDTANEIFVYDPDTGYITNKVRRSSTAYEGDRAGRIDSKGYLRIRVKDRTFRAHRLAWWLFYGEWPAYSIDHINRDRSDNRICNLRSASRVENQGNSKLNSNNTSGYKGVTYDGKRWRSYISIENKTKLLGVFDTKEQAAEAYAAAARLHFGEFANPAKSDAVP